jgi:hypothetical protein
MVLTSQILASSPGYGGKEKGTREYISQVATMNRESHADTVMIQHDIGMALYSSEHNAGQGLARNTNKCHVL